MAIFRVEKNNNYVTMNRTSLKDERLSWKAKGLHAYMLSMPDDWEFYDTELERHAKDGRDALKSAIKELKEHGYLIRKQIRKKDGKIAYETTVVEKPLTDNPSTDNPQVLSTETLEEEENAIRFYQQNFGMGSPYIMENIIYWIDDLSNNVVLAAMKEALDHNARNWKYVERILKDWVSKNVRTIEDIQGLKKEFEQKRKPKQAPQQPEQYNESADVSDELDEMFGG